ncbi:MAG: glutathione S-transferase family protein [Pseudomonadota bacterium]
MFHLYHLWLSPSSRMVRLLLNELRLPFDLHIERTWERREAFLRMNPAGDVPLLVDDNIPIVGPRAISEFLIEQSNEQSLIGYDPHTRAEIRRLCDWFDLKFNHDVVQMVVDEKIMKRFLGKGTPNSNNIRSGIRNLSIHLNYIQWLTQRRVWLASERMTLADLTAAAHISCLDYVGCIAWDHFPDAKNWYARLKSRPSFKSLLQDYIPGVKPPDYYTDLDF